MSVIATISPPARQDPLGHDAVLLGHEALEQARGARHRHARDRHRVLHRDPLAAEDALPLGGDPAPAHHRAQRVLAGLRPATRVPDRVDVLDRRRLGRLQRVEHGEHGVCEGEVLGGLGRVDAVAPARRELVQLSGIDSLEHGSTSPRRRRRRRRRPGR